MWQNTKVLEDHAAAILNQNLNHHIKFSQYCKRNILAIDCIKKQKLMLSILSAVKNLPKSKPVSPNRTPKASFLV
jgi:hypothetical protein